MKRLAASHRFLAIKVYYAMQLIIRLIKLRSSTGELINDFRVNSSRFIHCCHPLVARENESPVNFHHVKAMLPFVYCIWTKLAPHKNCIPNEQKSTLWCLMPFDHIRTAQFRPEECLMEIWKPEIEAEFKLYSHHMGCGPPIHILYCPNRIQIQDRKSVV